jgi:ubiquinone/menaquinone biosynthesis C-methylase UbiE
MKSTWRRQSDYELEYGRKKSDIPFWAKLIRELKAKSILELAVGNGRVLIPLLNSLKRQVDLAVGLDVDQELLDQAEQKLKKISPKIKTNVSLVKQDMRSFRLGQKFDFIFIPFSSFALIFDRTDQKKVLASVARHLSPGGHFALEVFAPDLPSLAAKTSKWAVEKKEVMDGKSGLKLVKTRKSRYHPNTQLSQTEDHYQRYDLKDNRLLEEYTTAFSVYKFFPTELRLLLENQGFKIERFWGDYERNQFADDSKKMIVIARKEP